MGARISIALCTHNGERYVEKQLRSIVDQSIPPDEIIMSDDASTDGTIAIAQSAVEKMAIAGLNFVVKTNDPALGVTANFESAVRSCTGDLIVLCDQDDVWRYDRLARAAQEFGKRDDLTLLFSDARLIDQNGDWMKRSLFNELEVSGADLASFHRGNGFSVLIKRNIATGATVMFRRSLLDVALPFPSGWVHDEWLAIVASMVGEIDALDVPLIDYRQHGSNQIGVQHPSFARKLMRALEPRGDRNERIAVKFAQLVLRLQSMPTARISEYFSQALAKSAFESSRQALPRAWHRRIKPIYLAERAGLYRQFASQGRLDILRDLLQQHS